MNYKNKLKAFTLAEVLITLGIIGVVAALTLPTILTNAQTKANERKKELFESRITEAMSQMQVHEKLDGYATADDFVDELEKYFKINERCTADKLNECFPSEITGTETTVEILDYPTGDTMVIEGLVGDYTSDNVGLITSDGVSVVINYNKVCKWLDPYTTEARNTGLSTSSIDCISMVYDINSMKGANTIGKDIFEYNAELAVNYKLIGSVKWDLQDTPITPIDCTDNSTEDYANYCANANVSEAYNKDYWAGAMKACTEAGKSLPTMTELALLHDYLFNLDAGTIEPYSRVDNLKLDEEKLSEFNFTKNYGYYYHWASENISSSDAWGRCIDSTWSYEFLYYTARNLTRAVARCVR